MNWYEVADLALTGVQCVFLYAGVRCAVIALDRYTDR